MSLLDGFEEKDDIVTTPEIGAVDEFAFDSARANPYFVGHQEAEETLLKLYNRGEMPHGWLFSGPDGIGKTTFAFRLAKFLFVEGGKGAGNGLFGGEEKLPATSLDVDQTHPAIQRVLSSGHGDLMVIQPSETGKEEIKVGDIRPAIDFLRKTSAEGGWRVVIIEDADQMNNAAQNALLKILEEPPKQTVLILIATTPAKLLPTIKSRCRALSFDPLTDADLRQLLIKSGSGSDSGWNVDQLIALSKGSFGRILEMTDGKSLEAFRFLLEGLETYPQLNRKTLHDVSDKVCVDRGGKGCNAFFDITLWWLERLINTLGKQEKYIPLLPEEETIMNKLNFDQKSVEGLLDLWDKITTLRNTMRWSNLDARSAVISVFLYFEKTQ